MKDLVILKTYCKYIFVVGSGNFWYEDGVVGDDKSVSYKLYAGFLFSLYGVMTILEIMAATIGEFPEDEKRDSVTFAVSHTVVMLKFFSVISNKKLIRTMNKNMIRLCVKHEEPKLMAEKYKIVKINIAAYFFTVYGAAACFVFEGFRKVHEGQHFATVITYYPGFDDNSIQATSFRIFTTLILNVMCVTMIVSVDSFTMAYLIMYKYKFITLRHYFDSLIENFKKMNETGNSRAAAEQLTTGFVEGIKMHQELLRMAKDIDTAFGTVMALQLCQSSGSAVSLLLQIAAVIDPPETHTEAFPLEEDYMISLASVYSISPLSEQLTFVAGMKIIFFVVALFFLLGLFLCNAGEITYQASLLADAIFYCGWHECAPQPPPQRNLRQLVLLACAQAQQPLVMKAFKMIPLSYGTFLQVLRGTYSVFALFYAQNT